MAISVVRADVDTDADITSWASVTRASGFDTFAATPTSANLRALVTDESGSGALLFANGALGTPASGVLTNATGLPVSTGISGLGTDWATVLGLPAAGILDNLSGVRYVATYAALTALTTATGLSDNAVYYTYGRAAEEDGGAGFWRYDSGVSTTANGGTILAIDGGGAGRFFRLADSEAPQTLKQFGAVGTAAAYDNTAIQAAVTQADARPVYASEGHYALSAKVSASKPMAILGVGTGSGPGTAEQLNSDNTKFSAYYAADYVFEATSLYPSRFENFQIGSDASVRPQTAGGGISIKGTGSALAANSRIQNVTGTHLYNFLYFYKPVFHSVRNVYCDAIVNTGALYETASPNEGAGGWLTESYFYGTAGKSTTSAGVLTRIGYLNIVNTSFTGEAYSVDLSVRDYPAGALNVSLSHLEDYGIAAFRARTVDGEDASMLRFIGNEISNVSYADSDAIGEFVIEADSGVWLDTVIALGNVHRSAPSNTSFIYYDVRSGTNVGLFNNIVTHLAANTGAKVVKIGSQAANVYVTGFVFDATDYTTPYDLTTETALFDINNGITVAQAPTVKNGSIAYFSDGKPGSAPLQGSGAGTVGIRRAGAWEALDADAQSFTYATDAAVTIGDQYAAVLVASTFTASRAITLPTNRNFVEISHHGTGDNVTISTALGTVTLTPAQWGHFRKTGGNWYCSARGAL